MQITLCPSCGNNNMTQVKKDWRGQFQGETYCVPALTFYECPDCGEKLYDRQAMRKIEAHSPAFAKTKTRAKKKALASTLDEG